MATKGDGMVITGKGNEPHIAGSRKAAWSDKKIVKEAIKSPKA